MYIFFSTKTAAPALSCILSNWLQDFVQLALGLRHIFALVHLDQDDRYDVISFENGKMSRIEKVGN